MNELPRITARYNLDKLIRASDAASVFRATDLRSGRTVALKLLSGGARFAEAQRRERFESACIALQACHHPCLPEILDFGITGGGAAYLVTEYLPGATLDLLSGSPPERIVPLLIPVLGGLEELDRHQLAHRALRADNLLVVAPDASQGDEAEETVKIVGWGSATRGAGEEGRRADLRAFATLTCNVLGGRIEHKPAVVVILPPATGARVADAEELAILLSLLLQPGGSLPSSLYGELRQAFGQALFGKPDPEATRPGVDTAAGAAAAGIAGIAASGAPPAGAQANRAARLAAATRAAADLEEETNALRGDITMAVPRDRLKLAPPDAPRGPAGAGAAESAAPAQPVRLGAGAPAIGAPAIGAPAIGAPAIGAATVGAATVGAPATAAAGKRVRPLRSETLPAFLPSELDESLAGQPAGVGAVLPFPSPPAGGATEATSGLAGPRSAAGAEIGDSPDPAGPSSPAGAGTQEPPASIQEPANVPATPAGWPHLAGGSPALLAGTPERLAGGATPPASSSTPGVASLAPLGKRRSAVPAIAGGIAMAILLAAILALAGPPLWRRLTQSPSVPAAGSASAAAAAARQGGASRAGTPAGATSAPAGAPAAAVGPGTTATGPAATPAGPPLDPQLQAVQDAIATNDPVGARRLLAQITAQQQAAFDPANREAFAGLTAVLAADRRAQIVADLTLGWRRGDLRRLGAALAAARHESGLPPKVQQDLERARQAVDLDGRLAQMAQIDPEKDAADLLATASRLLAILPNQARAMALRDSAARALETQADAAVAAGDAGRAAALLASLGQQWPDRAGLADRNARVEAQRRSDEQMDGVLAAAARAETAGQPLQGLETLAATTPTAGYRERFQKQRERLNQLLAKLDAAPPAITLGAGWKAEYDKGQTVVVPLRISDDLAVKTVECWVRPEGATAYQTLAVRHVGGDFYEVGIAPAVHQNRPLELYAVATDNSGHQGLLASRDKPLKIKRRNWIEKIFTGKEPATGR